MGRFVSSGSWMGDEKVSVSGTQPQPSPAEIEFFRID